VHVRFQREKEEMANTIAALEGQVKELQQDKAALELQRGPIA
jgi:hypothetical protein